MKFNIPIFRLKFSLGFKLKFLRGAWDILSSDRPLGESKYVKEFETKFSSLVGSKYAIACSNGTTAIELALKAIDVNGKKVICPSNTFFATTVAINNAGAEVVLADCEKETFSISYNHLKKIISENEIAAVVIVHIGGIISKDIAKIVSLCKKHNITLIEDAAHAHGSQTLGYTAGTIGDIACFSFFPTKVMTTGEGGMLTTNNKDYFEKIKSLKNFGRDNQNAGIIINPHGNNFKIHEFTGLMGSLECDRVLGRILIRTNLLKRYEQNLEDTSFKVIIQKEGRCSYYKCILLSPYNTNELKQYCKEHSISLTGEVYRIPVHQQPLYANLIDSTQLKNTNYIANKHICPPLYPELTFKEVDYICDVLKKFDNEKQSR
jgi:dTDP-4-amino-4,6-dideoxygalactose transaminase